VWALAVANLVGAFMLAAFGRWLGIVSIVAGDRLVPFVLTLVIIGCLIASVHVQSLSILTVLGALGVVLKRLRWPRPPFAIGLVLGATAERALHQAWSIWGAAFLLRPGAIILLLLIAGSIFFHVVRPVRVPAAR
jgi:TctA family transporter